LAKEICQIASKYYLRRHNSEQNPEQLHKKGSDYDWAQLVS